MSASCKSQRVSGLTPALPAVFIVAVIAVVVFETDADRIDAYCAYGAKSEVSGTMR